MRTAVGIVLVIAGLIWMAQGLNLAFAPRSFMTANSIWILWGGVAAGVGGILIWIERRNNRDSD